MTRRQIRPSRKRVTAITINRLIFGFISQGVDCLTRELGGGLLDSLDAAGAEGGVLVVRADGGFPAPAAFAFFTLGIGHGDLQFLTFARFELKFLDVD